MDKIREDIEQEVGQEAYDIGYKDGLRDSNKSRDEEINELVKQKTIMRNIITVRDKKINKLNEIISTQETYINNTLISDSDKVESKIKKLREDRKELIENIKYFVDRVEDGTIRSKKTYAIYTNLLSRMKETE